MTADGRYDVPEPAAQRCPECAGKEVVAAGYSYAACRCVVARLAVLEAAFTLLRERVEKFPVAEVTLGDRSTRLTPPAPRRLGFSQLKRRW